MKKILFAAILLLQSSISMSNPNDEFNAIIHMQNWSDSDTVKVTGPLINGAYMIPRGVLAPRLPPPSFPAVYKFEGANGEEFILDMDKNFEIKECAQSVYDVHFKGWRYPEPVMVLSRRCLKYYDGVILNRIFK